MRRSLAQRRRAAEEAEYANVAIAKLFPLFQL